MDNELLKLLESLADIIDYEVDTDDYREELIELYEDYGIDDIIDYDSLDEALAEVERDSSKSIDIEHSRAYQEYLADRDLDDLPDYITLDLTPNQLAFLKGLVECFSAKKIAKKLVKEDICPYDPLLELMTAKVKTEVEEKLERATMRVIFNGVRKHLDPNEKLRMIAK